MADICIPGVLHDIDFTVGGLVVGAGKTFTDDSIFSKTDSLKRSIKIKIFLKKKEKNHNLIINDI